MDTLQLIDASVYVNDELIPIVPGSLKTTPAKGEVKARALAIGGNKVTIVGGLDTSTLLEEVKFEIANTSDDTERVEDWKRRSITNELNVIKLAWPGQDHVRAYLKAFMVNSPEADHSADGNIPVEFMAIKAGD